MNFVLKTFQKMLEKIENEDKFEESLSKIVREIENEVNFQTLAVYLREKKNPDNLRIQISRNLSQKYVNEQVISSQNKLFEDICRRKYLISRNKEEFSLDKDFSEVLLIPLYFRNEYFGFTAFTMAEYKFSESDIEQLQMFSSIISFIIKIYKQESKIRAYRDKDPETDLLNYNGFLNLTSHILKNTKRYKKKFSLAFFEINHYRELYEKHGSSKMHRLLNEIADILKTQLRETEIVARFNDHSFIVLLPETTVETAQIVVKRVFGYIMELNNIDKSHLHCGLCEWHEEYENIEKCIEISKNRAYEAYRENKILI